MKNLNDELGNMTEWNRAVIFDASLKTRGQKNIQTSEAELG